MMSGCDVFFEDDSDAMPFALPRNKEEGVFEVFGEEDGAVNAPNTGV